MNITSTSEKFKQKGRTSFTHNASKRIPKDAISEDDVSLYLDQDEDIYDEYGRTITVTDDLDVTPKDNVHSKTLPNLQFTPRALFSPASFSPLAVSNDNSKRYNERTNSKQVVCSYGNNVGGKKWIGQHWSNIIVQDCNKTDKKITYMFETLLDKAILFNKACYKNSKQILDKYELNNKDNYFHVSSETAAYSGRIACDGNGRLNVNSILLENDMEQIPLTVSKISNYSLFPGQIVVVEGTNPTGRALVAEKIHSDLFLPPSPVPVIKNALELVIASGPFTLSDAFTYEPLEDLQKYVIEHKPNLLILIGPIVDVTHSHIANGHLAESYEQCFQRILDAFLSKLKTLHTKVLLINNSREAMGYVTVYPTPVFHSNLTDKFPNFQITSDPSIIEICGIRIAVTSTDILMHLGKEEIFSSSEPQADRLGRLASHILRQDSFYPLYPEAEDINIDYGLFEQYGNLHSIPHLLILPSDLKGFIKELKGCVTINPERLCKGQVGGTFARVSIEQTSDLQESKISSCISTQIIKI